jgi:hypothetical protein
VTRPWVSDATPWWPVAVNNPATCYIRAGIRSLCLTALRRPLWVLVALGAVACQPTTVTVSDPTPSTVSSTGVAGASAVSGVAALAVPDLASLVHMADLIVVGRVAGPGATGTVAPVNPGELSQPLTTYPIALERLIRGQPGADPLEVTQFGNPIRGAPPGPDDAPLAAGERYVLFLKQIAGGSYVTVGGVQGRLRVDGANTVHLVGSGSPATRAQEGQSLDAFVGEVNAIK